MCKLFAKTLLWLVMLCSVAAPAFAQTIKIWPTQGVGSGVSYGGDVKLTLFEITKDGNTNSVNTKLKDKLKMDMVRVPYVPIWGINDGKYNDIKNYINNADSKGMKIFLSVANTNGQFANANNNNYTLKGAHHGDKFPQRLKGGNGVYSLNITAYKNYVNDVIDLLGRSKIDYVGYWNEDNAKEGDYFSVNKPVVGYEAFKLTDATNRYGATGGSYDGIRSKISVAGSHDYNGSYSAAYGQWKNFASKGNKEEWFTETTKYDNSTAEGIGHMLPAISAGLPRMIIYQAVPRLVKADGTNGPHYAATRRLILHSKGKGSARRVEFAGNNQLGLTAAFKDGNKLHIHLSNVATGQKTYYINLQGGQKITGATRRKYGGAVSLDIRNNGTQIAVTIAGKTYAHITCTGLQSTNNRVAETPTFDQEFVEFATRLYPNPTTGVFTVLLPDYEHYEGQVEFSIHNLQGQVVDHKTVDYVSSLKVDYGYLPRGCYIVNIKLGEITVHRKIWIGA